MSEKERAAHARMVKRQIDFLVVREKSEAERREKEQAKLLKALNSGVEQSRRMHEIRVKMLQNIQDSLK